MVIKIKSKFLTNIYYFLLITMEYFTKKVYICIVSLSTKNMIWVTAS
jgi:hypothetical protein